MTAFDEPDLDTTGEDEVRSLQRLRLRDRMSDVGLIAVMACATIVAVGAVLGWALFTGDSHKGDLGSTKTTPLTRTVDVTLGEFWVKPAKIEVAADTTLVVNITNTGSQPHDLRIGSKASPKLAPGQSAVVRTSAIAASLQGYCTLPGHRSSGMVMDIEVVGADDAAVGNAGPAAGGHDAREGADGAFDPNDATITPSVEPAEGFEATDPVLPPPPAATVHNVTLVAKDIELEVAPGVRQLMWTFNDTVPAPTLRGQVGDTFNITLVNKGTMGHSLDFHASQTSMDVDMRTIQPGESLTYSFVAEHSGVWMYHCGTSPVTHHIANGMFGLVVIDPPQLAQVDHEYVMVQSELYLGPPGKEIDLAKAMAGAQDAVVFNGYYNQYVYDPIEVAVGDRIRIYVLNVGPNEISAFHVVGAQFDTAYKEGAYLIQPDNPTRGAAQVLGLMPGQGGFVEFTVPAKGMYAMVTHKFNDAERGGMGHIIAR